MMSRIKTFLYGLALIALAAVVTSQQPPPARAQQAGPTYCSQSAFISGTGQLKVITGTQGNKIYICGYDTSASAAATLQLKTGTGTNCASAPIGTLTPIWNLVAGVFNFGFGNFAGIGPVPPLVDVCVDFAATTGSVEIYYSQQ